MSVPHLQEEKALELIHSAILAPSSHNTQPWFFQKSPNGIDLYADRTRALPANDPDDREMTISCGCALMNLRIAAASNAIPLQLQIHPDPADHDLLARACMAAHDSSTSADAELFPYIQRRRTYRKRFADRDVDITVIQQLEEAAKMEGTWLTPLLTDTARKQASELIAEGDAAQWANPSWRRELAAWMHPRRHGDGLTVPSLAAPIAQLVVRTFDMGGGVGAKDRQLAEASPLLAVLGTESDHPIDWLATGMALQRVLLVACRNGLQASYLNQPIQMPSLRPKLQNLVGGGFPQILLRLGYPTEDIPASPRRPVEQVIAAHSPH